VVVVVPQEMLQDQLLLLEQVVQVVEVLEVQN
jgi:hypothetical protein